MDIGPGNGLMLSGNKPVPGPMLTQIFVIVLYHLLHWENAFPQGKCGNRCKCAVSRYNEVINNFGNSPWSCPHLNLQDCFGGKSTLVQVLARWRSNTCHYLNQCWASFIMPHHMTMIDYFNTNVLSNLVKIGSQLRSSYQIINITNFKSMCIFLTNVVSICSFVVLVQAMEILWE